MIDRCENRCRLIARHLLPQGRAVDTEKAGGLQLISAGDRQRLLHEGRLDEIDDIVERRCGFGGGRIDEAFLQRGADRADQRGLHVLTRWQRLSVWRKIVAIGAFTVGTFGLGFTLGGIVFGRRRRAKA